MITLVQPANVNLFASIVTKFNMAETLADIIHFTFFCMSLALLHYISMGW